MTNPDPLEIIKKHGKAAVEDHLREVREQAADIKQRQWEIDQILDTVENRIQSLSKGQRKVAGSGTSKAQVKAYTFLREIIEQEARALELLDYVVIAVNAKDPSAAYENTPSTIFDFTRMQEDPYGRNRSPEALVDQMKGLLEKQPGYMKEGKIRFREPRLKGTAEYEGAVVNIFYTTAKGDNYLSLFDHEQTRAFLKAKGYITAHIATGG
jgi:hypothetical protein